MDKPIDVDVEDNTSTVVRNKSPTALKESINERRHTAGNKSIDNSPRTSPRDRESSNVSHNESQHPQNIEKPKKRLPKRKPQEKVSISWGDPKALVKPFPSSHSPLLAKPIPLLFLLLVPTIIYYTLGEESQQIRGILFIVITALCWRYFLKISDNKTAKDNTTGSDWGQEYLKGRVTINFRVPVNNISYYLEEKAKQLQRDDVNITHVVVRAVGLALKETPELNGHSIFGKFYPAKTIDVSCEVRQNNGTSALLKVFDADKKSVDDIYYVMTKKSQAMSQNQDIFLNRRNAILHSFPVQFIPGLVDVLDTIFTFISCTLGISIPYLGIKAFPQGVCTVILSKLNDSKNSRNEVEVIIERDIDQERKNNSSRSNMILTIGRLDVKPQLQEENGSVPILMAYLTFSLVVYLRGGGSLLSVRKFSDKLQYFLSNPSLMGNERKKGK